jgi:putative FmdB family regulatory protein
LICIGFGVPIYEYYCHVCNRRFSHLARQIDAAAPLCPRCGDASVERLISAGHLIHGATHHARALREDVASVDRENPQAAARALRASGRLDDASGLYGSRAYRELIERRTEGAVDADLTDLVDDLVSEAAATEAAQMASAVVLSDEIENRMAAQGPPEVDEGSSGDVRGGRGAARSRRKAPDLGWG